MKLLLDTHCFLWMVGGSDRIAAKVRRRLEDPTNELLLSAASAWELAIKVALGKLTLPMEPARYVPSRVAQLGLRALPIEIAHALRAAALPRHHADPFDRLLVAQAQIERVAIVTADRQLEAYDVKVMRAEA
jgi:PIN domain nuclease of toxin-antitoxin system